MEADKFFPFFLFPSLLVKLDFYHNRVNYVPFVQEIDPNPKFGIVFKFRDTNIFSFKKEHGTFFKKLQHAIFPRELNLFERVETRETRRGKRDFQWTSP